uniref:Transposase n=1 Tax=Anaerobacillus isosaccharinicus TaxID=1532552 RepID=A0A1S2L905_9BACI|nr:TnsD family Tn7-like transposition protein [Anaerobacillus isosaccharinicus]MBA5583999.1 TniQ family protein [Anaerobacillus isosaccharinicus]QOY37584.1 TnsD family transposase [Anaerobacillus isosaccharinicus]
MLPFFTEPYPDELIYSAIARYHFYSGNLDCKDTLEEVFQSRTVIPSLEIGSHFTNLVTQIGTNYSVEKLVSEHTIYPYYAPLLTSMRQQQIMQDVIGDGKGLYARLGMVAGGICKKDGLYYCSQCSKNDIERFGEPYIHREHQLQGINLCAHHSLHLKKYPIDFTISSRIEFIRFEHKKMDLSVLQGGQEKYSDLEVQLARMAYKFLKVNISKFSREKIVNKYRALLRERGYITTANHVRQQDLHKDFLKKIPNDFLETYDSFLDIDDEYNWLKVLTRNIKRHVHPIRHLYFLCFLEQDIERFLEEVTEDQGPFGTGPWPCLNKAANHYKRPVIKKVTVTRDYKSKAPIGTFECTCGFVYARKGPDQFANDLYHIGRIKVFGNVWKAKLIELEAEQTYSIRALAKMLGVDSKTIKKYLQSEEDKSKSSMDSTSQLELPRQIVLNGINSHPDHSRTAIRKLFPKEYMYLYRYDKEWLLERLPNKKAPVQSKGKIDWYVRDLEYMNKMKALHNELISLEKPVRITKSLIGKRLGIVANLENHLDKLSLTATYLNKICESVQAFQIRRCCKIINRMIKNEEPVLLWKVQRLGGVKSHHFHEIKSILESYLCQRQEVDCHDQTTS